jgi:methylmalonyl-CoA/ethylmalonyl-CoA epimerase
MSSRLDHIGIFVDDLEAAVTIFTETFQLAVDRRVDDPERGVRAAFLEWGDASIELFSPTDPDRRAALSGQGGPLHHLGIAVADIDATLQRLAGVGVKAAGTPSELGGRRAVFLETEPFMHARIQLLEIPVA